MNKWIGIGRLTADPNVTTTSSGGKVANFNVAVDRNKEEADFIKCTSFGKQAEFAEQHLHKGVKIAIDGRIQTGSYKDKDGRTNYTWCVIVNQTEFCEPKKTIQTETQADEQEPQWEPPWR